MHDETPEGPRLHTFSVLLTGRCNLDCAYCYRGGGGGRDLAEPALDAALLMALRPRRPAGKGQAGQGQAGQGPAYQVPKVEVVFTGGEPALRFDVFRSAVARLHAGDTEAGPVAVRLMSNGLLLTEARLDFLVEQGVDLSLSLDGAARAQRLRGAATVGRLDRLLQRLRRRHPEYLARRVRAVMTLLPETVGDLAASVDHLLDAGLTEIRAAPVMSPVPGWDDDLRAVLATQLTAVRRRCEERLAATGEIPFIPLRRYGMDTVPEDPAGDVAVRRPCAICSGSAPVLDTDGRLYACLMFAPSGLAPGPDQQALRRVAAAIDLGRPSEPGYAERAARLPAALAGRPGFGPQSRLSSRLGACATCPARALCRICPYLLLRFAGDAECTRVPAFACAYFRELARQRALIPAQRATGPARWRPEAIEERRVRFLEKIGACGTSPQAPSLP